MKRKQLLIGLGILLFIAAVAYAVCSGRVYCIQHEKYASYDSVEHEDGKCTCVYRHVFPTHTLRFECDE